jgi:DNA modification methylase
MTIHYQDDQVTLLHGPDVDMLGTLPPGSANCVVTSPPYFGLRDYGVEGQRGLEQSPAEYVAGMVEVFREVRRVLADDGTLWMNVGDSYYSGKGSPTQPDIKNEARRPPARVLDQPGADWAKPKDLLGIPWRVAFALQDDGWILRNDIIWAKPNAMPESVTDRLSSKHEHLFLFSKSRRYWFDLDPIREPLAYPADRPQNSWDRDTKEADVPGQSMRQHRSGRPGKGGGTNLRPTGRQHLTPDTHGGRNPGDVWTIPTTPFPGAHFAVFPLALAERCILAGCKPGGTVLDPYSGSGTTGLAAARHGRRYVGIDLNAEYLDLSLRTRLQQAALIPDEEAS